MQTVGNTDNRGVDGEACSCVLLLHCVVTEKSEEPGQAREPNSWKNGPCLPRSVGRVDLSEVAVVRVPGDEGGLGVILRCCAATLFNPKMREAPNSDCLAAGQR